MTDPKSRTEDDLRAAFQLAAQDAPSTQDVLARIRAAERPAVAGARPPGSRPSGLRRWAPLAAVAAIVLAIGVPVGIWGAGDHDSGGSSSSAAMADSGEKAATAPSVAGRGAASDAGGATASVPSGPAFNTSPPASTTPAAGRVCTPADVRLALSWEPAGSGGFVGILKAESVASTPCDLAVKPSVYPLDANGTRLPVQNIMTLEGMVGTVVLAPGATAASTITWRSWCGTAASDKAEVEWGTGVATAVVSGNPTPSCKSGEPTTISSTWFALR